MLCRGREKDRRQILAFFYDFECTQNTFDAETDRPVYKVNYCVAMSVCDKCTDDHPCEDCSQTFSGLEGRDALKDFACGRLMIRLTLRPSSLHTMAVTTIHISFCLI